MGGAGRARSRRVTGARRWPARYAAPTGRLPDFARTPALRRRRGAGARPAGSAARAAANRLRANSPRGAAVVFESAMEEVC